MYLNPLIMDQGLFTLVKRATQLHVLPEETSNFETVTNTIIGTGVPIVSGPRNAPAGREVEVVTTAGLTVMDGSAAAFALVDDNYGRVLYSAPLLQAMNLEVDNTFTLDPFTIGFTTVVAMPALTKG